MGSAAAGRGVALVRLDRAAEALAQGAALAAGGEPIGLVILDWARFSFPGETEVRKPNKGRRMTAHAHDPIDALPVAQTRSALHRLSRSGMGRAGIRRPRALRKARARRLPGRPVLDHHPAQARQFPPRLRRLRARENRALPAGQDRTADGDAGIVRNRAKIEGAMPRRAPGSTSWKRGRASPSCCGISSTAAQDQPLPHHETGAGRNRDVTRDLERTGARGFKFCGPTIVYAFMQAVGMVNDHLVSCYRHEAVEKISK